MHKLFCGNDYIRPNRFPHVETQPITLKQVESVTHNVKTTIAVHQNFKNHVHGNIKCIHEKWFKLVCGWLIPWIFLRTSIFVHALILSTEMKRSVPPRCCGLCIAPGTSQGRAPMIFGTPNFRAPMILGAPMIWRGRKLAMMLSVSLPTLFPLALTRRATS